MQRCKKSARLLAMVIVENYENPGNVCCLGPAIKVHLY